MNNFIFSIFNNLFVLIYAIALIMSIYRYRRYYDSVLKYLPAIIGYTLANEILGGIIKYNNEYQIVFSDGHSYDNNLIFNIWDIIFFLYFFYIYWKTIKTIRFKVIIKYASIGYILISIGNLFNQDIFLYPQVYAICYGSMLLLITILFYVIDLKRNPTQIPYSNNLLLWVSIGLLLFYSCYPFIMVSMTYFYDIYVSLSLRTLLLTLIITMYSCFTIGFIRMRKIKKE